MSRRIEKNGLSIDEKLVTFIESEAIPGTGVDNQKFWQGFAEIVEKLGPKNKTLLQKREDIQSKIDEYHITHRGQDIDIEDYKSKHIIVKCKLGGRSAQAQMQLKSLGFQKVINLSGGITKYCGEIV